MNKSTRFEIGLSSVKASTLIVADADKRCNNEINGGYQQDFEISRFTSLLTPTKEKDKHICPNCGGHNFSIGTKGYRCFNHECSVKVPLLRLSYQSYGLARTDAKAVILDNQGRATYHYPDGNRVERFIGKDGKKVCPPYENGNQKSSKTKKWLPYRWELIETSDKWLLGCEGEKCVESLILKGFKALTWCGAGNDWDYIYEDARKLYQQGVHGFIYFRDNDDNPGKLKAEKVARAFRRAGIWVVVVNPSEFSDQYNIDKFDIADLLEKEPAQDVFKWVSAQVSRSFELAATRSGKSSNSDRQTRQTSNSARQTIQPDATANTINWDGIQNQYLGCRTDRDREVYKLAIAQEYNLNPYDVGRILDSSHDDDSSGIGDEVAKALVSRDIDLDDYLPSYLAVALKQYANFQRINQSTILTALLATVSSLHKPGSKTWLHPGINFGIVPTLFSAIVAESGSKKSPIFREICKTPLSKIRREELKNFADSLVEYQKMSDDEKADNSEPKAPAPMFITDATSEGLTQLASDFPNKSILLAVDELAGMFYSQNAYRGGRGSDKQKMLTAYDGSGNSVSRAEGLKRESEHMYLSILGTIQPDVAAKIIGDNQDSDGTFARFIFCRQPNVAGTLPDWDVNVSVSGLLSGIYQNILDRPVSEFNLSPPAFKIFQKFYNQCEELRIKSPSPFERYFWGKAEGLAGRLAMNLEVLHDPLGTGETISEESMQSAIALVNFYHGELMALMVSVDPINSLAPHLVRLIEMSMRMGEISPRDVYCGYSAKDRPNSQKVRGWMVEAENLGLGKILGSGRNIKFVCNDGNDGAMMATSPSFQILTQQGLQPNDGNDGNDGDFPEKNSHLNNLGDTSFPDTSFPDSSPHLETLGDTFFEQNSHQRHHCHQTAENLDIQGQTMMATSPSISPSFENHTEKVEGNQSIPTTLLEPDTNRKKYSTDEVYEVWDGFAWVKSVFVRQDSYSLVFRYFGFSKEFLVFKDSHVKC